MGIRKNKTGGYKVDVSVDGRRKTATCPTLQLAKAKEAELTHLIMSAERDAPVMHKDSATWTLGYGYKRTNEIVWSGSKGEATVLKNAKQGIAYFGANTALDDIDTNAIDGYVAHCIAKGNANGTVNRKLAVISKIMTVAVDRGFMRKKPKIPRRKESQCVVTYLTAEQEQGIYNLLTQWGMNDQLDAFVVLVDTGIRIGELFAMTNRFVDFQQGLIMLPDTKSGIPRGIPMTTRVREIIKRRINQLSTPQQSVKVFPHNYDWFKRPWNKAKEVLGHGDDLRFTPHICRRTTASRLVQRGVHLKVVQEWLGHKTIQVTMRYATLAPESLHQAMNVLEQDYQQA